MLERLRALWSHDQPPGGYREALAALDRRVAALEASVADCLEVVELESERAARWADMNAQLRRFLGRLDAHAQKDRQAENGHGPDPKQLAAILRSKYPHSGA